jgi:hypothetical protein
MRYVMRYDVESHPDCDDERRLQVDLLGPYLILWPSLPTMVPTSHVCTTTFILYWPAFVLQEQAADVTHGALCMRNSLTR